MLIDLDSVIPISLFDHLGLLQQRANRRIQALDTAGDRAAFTDLTRLECRVQPLQLADQVRLAVFDAFFAQPGLVLLPIDRPVFDRATEIRARHGLKTVDVLHLAAAVVGGCDTFLTNDARLSGFADITVEVLP